MSWTIDPAHTQIEFSVKHMMIAAVRGRFTKFNGTLKVNDADLLKSSVEGSVEAASLDTHDPNRDAHLRSPDFFDAEKYPMLSFRGTRITPKGDDRYQVAGDLTIKDVTREVVFEVTNEGHSKDPWGNQRWGLTAQTTINRKEYGLNWNVALETGGWLVGDQIKVNVDLELVYQADTPAEEAKPEAEAAA